MRALTLHLRAGWLAFDLLALSLMGIDEGTLAGAGGTEVVESPNRKKAKETPGQAPSAEDIADLIERYTENLMRAAFSLGFPDSEAEELVQATFCAYLEGGSRFEKRSRVLTYLFGILYNKARETRRYQGRHDSMDAAVDEAFDGHFDGAEHWNTDAEKDMTEVEAKAQSAAVGEMLRDCLEKLGASMRMAFTMKEVEGCDPREICSALNITPNNLGVLLFRTRNRLRECLTAKGAVIV